MNDQEIIEYAAAAKTLTEHFTTKTSFTEADIRFIHKTMYGKIIDWAGEYRNVDLSKDGFVFARAFFIKRLMEKFSSTLLRPSTPPRNLSRSDLCMLLANIHVEFILIHPFREWNGRTIRLLLSLIAQQINYAELDFSLIKSRGKEFNNYITAIQRGINGDLNSLQKIIDRTLSR